MFKFKLKHGLLALTLAFASQMFVPTASADLGDEYVRDFGLIVHQANRERGVSRAKAVEVLMKYYGQNNVKEKAITPQFKDVDKDSNAYPYVEQACRLEVFKCNKPYFYPTETISQKDFISWFGEVRSLLPNVDDSKYSKIEDDYMRTWLNARRNNWLITSEITYNTLKEFLYRHEVSYQHGQTPYFPGLVLSKKDINTDNFTSINGVASIQEKLSGEVKRLKSIKRKSNSEKYYLSRIEEYQEDFTEIHDSLKEANHPLNLLKNLPADIRADIEKYELNEIMGSFAYDYSHNAPYRKHNVTQGALKMQGVVIMPGEEADFIKQLSNNGWSEFVYGYTVVAGVPTWEFGGGLSGSSTMISLPAYLAGLELTQFSPHRLFYVDLYPTEYIGLDTTIYRPSKNLKVKNNTNDPVIYYVDDNVEEEVITVYIIGNAPYKSLEHIGPIELGNRTFKWIRQFEHFDGTITRDERITHYDAIH